MISFYLCIFASCRYQLIDYTPVVEFGTDSIVSKKRVKGGERDGGFLYNTFDLTTFGLIGASILLIPLTLWITSSPKRRSWSRLGSAIFHMFGFTLEKGLPTEGIFGQTILENFLVSLYGFMVVVLAKSFAGIITASLLVPTTYPQIESLWQVAADPKLTIIVEEGSYFTDILLSHPAADSFKDRIEYRPGFYSKEEITQTLDKVLAGTHVMIHGYPIQLDLNFLPNYVNEQFYEAVIFSSPNAFGVSKHNKSAEVLKYVDGVGWYLAFGLWFAETSRDTFDTFTEGVYEHHPPGQGPTECPAFKFDESGGFEAIEAGKRKLLLEIEGQKNTISPLEFKNISSLMVMLSIGLGFSSIVFVLELAFNKATSCCYQKGRQYNSTSKVTI